MAHGLEIVLGGVVAASVVTVIAYAVVFAAAGLSTVLRPRGDPRGDELDRVLEEIFAGRGARVLSPVVTSRTRGRVRH